MSKERKEKVTVSMCENYSFEILVEDKQQVGVVSLCPGVEQMRKVGRRVDCSNKCFRLRKLVKMYDVIVKTYVCLS